MRRPDVNALKTPYPMGNKGKKNLVMAYKIFTGICQWCLFFAIIYLCVWGLYSIGPQYGNEKPYPSLFFFSAILSTCIMIVKGFPRNSTTRVRRIRF